MITLRPYQQDAIDKLLASLAIGKHPVCCIATGGGKSVVIAELCQRLEGRVLVVTHRRELIQQNESTLSRMGTEDTGVYSAGLSRRDTDVRVVFAGVASIFRRMAELQASGPFRYVLIDESHFGVSGQDGDTMYDQILRQCRKAQRVGFSATPYRMPDTPIWSEDGAWFDELTVNVGIGELTEQGYLTRLVGVQTASAPDLSNIRSRGGEFVMGDLSQASSEESVVNSAVDEILYLARDRRHILVFCVDRQHASVVGEAFRERGESPEIVLGNTPSDERSEILTRFSQGSIRYLINVGVLTTGYDCALVDCVAILRASMSKSLVVQMMGRGSRLHPEKTNCLILDAGGNLARHMPLDGLPKILRSPKLAEEQKVEREKREREERERLARHEAVVAKGIDPLATEHPDAVTLVVSKVSYLLRKAKRHPERQNLLVTYRGVTAGGMERSVTQFVLLEYPGRAGVEARAWFERRGLVMPDEPRYALAMAWRAKAPEAIVVKREDGWDKVIMEQFGGDDDHHRMG